MRTNYILIGRLIIDICAKRGVKSFYADDGNCRTYMKCNEKGLDDPYCCRPGQQYDRTLKRCVPTKDPSCMRQTCPGFSEGIYVVLLILLLLLISYNWFSGFTSSSSRSTSLLSFSLHKNVTTEGTKEFYE